MTDQIVYLAGVIAAAWLVTFLLRSLPFLLFAGKDRELPPSVERIAGYVSPVIIAGLIVYSYYGLYTAKYFVPAKDWAWPVLAGVLTVGLQLWKGNPLASILSGTVLYMCLIGLTGCTSVPVNTIHSSVAHPLIHITNNGVRYRDKTVMPDDIHKLLEKDHVSKAETLHVLVDPDFTDSRALWVFKNNQLNRYGYSKSIYMYGERQGISASAKEMEARDRAIQERNPIHYERQFQKKPQQKVFR